MHPPRDIHTSTHKNYKHIKSETIIDKQKTSKVLKKKKNPNKAL